MINLISRSYSATNLFGNAPTRRTNATLSNQERKQLNKMEQNFISKAKSENEKNGTELSLDELKDKVSKINEGDPYAGLTEEDAEKLEEMRNRYTSDIIQRKQAVYDREFDKACQKHNAEIDQIKAKCDKIARLVASGRNVSQKDIQYLQANIPTALSAALLQRSMTDLFEKDEEEKTKSVSNSKDKNFDDLEFPTLQFASGDLTETEKRGLPTAMDLPNYETDYAGKLPQATTQNNAVAKSVGTPMSSPSGGGFNAIV